MLLRSTTREKDGKVHRYWSVAENQRVRGGRAVQRHVWQWFERRAVLYKFSSPQVLDVHLPATDHRELVLSRYTEPEKDLQLLLMRLKFALPEQPPPKICAASTQDHLHPHRGVVKTFGGPLK